MHKGTVNEMPNAVKETITDLGFIFDKTLRFKYHIENIICKISAIQIKLYNTYVSSRLEYAAVIWLPYYKT